MKAVFIAYNQAHDEAVKEAMEKLFIKGFTMWQQVTGEGSKEGEPHLGSHAWPTLNSALISFMDDDAAKKLKAKLEELDSIKDRLGLRVFIWSIDN
ncbi:MAG: hypothetical protein IKZ50_05250 [Bacteroidales bacterium]|nr:hypothetical protein [Bacteroidales bacterium]MBR4980208.1 hypothetical protein [Bacteroidales bacterium]MBR5907782.1 hypothetical protein [Bacteroidales bacterium]